VGGCYPPTASIPYVSSRGQQADLPKKEKEAEKVKVCTADSVQNHFSDTIMILFLESEIVFVKQKMSKLVGNCPVMLH